MKPDEQQSKRQKPIAYDADGNPLYGSPQGGTQDDEQTYEQRWTDTRSHVTNAPQSIDGHNYDPRMRVQYSNEPRVVHNTREYEPQRRPISENLRQKHETSVKEYPNLNLSEGEFVILDIKRHPVGLFIPVFVTIATIILLLSAWVSIPLVTEPDPVTGTIANIGMLSLIILSLIILVGIFGYIAVWVYLRNTFYLTNESIIQEIQHGIFSKHEQTVSLGSIEDASYRQFGIWQTMFNYGTIRLSTEGEETTYRFQFVANPKQQIATVNNAIESFKNGRPVGDD